MKISEKFQKYIVESQTIPLKKAPIYLKILSILYKLIGRKSIAQFLTTSKKCNACKLCSKACPNQAINFKLNNPHRSNKCRGCLMCIYVCPNKAIELPLSILIGVLLLLFLPYDEFIAGLFSIKLSSLTPLLQITLSLILWSIGYIVTVFIFTKISFLFNILPFVKKLRENSFIKNIYNKIHPARIFPIIVPGNFGEADNQAI